LTEIVEAIEGGLVKALILVETDPFSSFPDRQRLEQAFNRLDFLLTLDYVHSESARLSHILFPTVPLFETASTFVNQEGRVQCSRRVHAGGTPIEQVSGGDHPPRTFRKDVPGSDPKPAWQIMNELADALFTVSKMSVDDIWSWLAQENPLFENLKLADPSGNIRLIPGEGGQNSFMLDWPGKKEESRPPSDSLDLLLVDRTFGTEELSGYSPYIRQVEKPPCLFMHPNDATKAGLKDRDRVALPLDGGPLEIEVSIAEDMAPGIMILPRHRQTEWQKVKGLQAKASLERIKKL
jgi:NADH-quinone oxidoreductase subunit G